MKRGLCLILTLFVLTGCAPAAHPVSGYAFTDDAGQRITVPYKPQRVAVLLSSYAEVWLLAGGRVQITVGESVERGFAEDSAILVDGGAGKSIDLERLIAAQPDFVLCSADIEAQRDAAVALNEMGIPAAQMRVESFEDYLRLLELCTTLRQNTEAYQQYGAQLQAQISSILSQAQDTSPEILFLRAGSGFAKAKGSADHFAAQMLQQLGAVNLADEAPVLLDGLNIEAILKADPDRIFIAMMGDEAAARAYVEELFTQEGWSSLSAVQSGAYTFLDKDLFHYKPNARWAEAYEVLEAALYGP